MEYSNWQQLIIFLYGIAIGLGFGLLFDIFRAIRVFLGGKLAVFFQDFIYFLLCAVVVFVYLFIFNRGQVRFFALLAVLAGSLFYYLTVGRYIFSFIRKLIKKLKALICKIGRKKKEKKSM